MRRTSLAVPILCLIAIACFLFALNSNNNQFHPDSQLDDFVISQPIYYENLAIFAVSSRQLRDQDRFITLDEGLKAGTVKIFEVGASGNVINASAMDGPATENDGNSPPQQNQANSSAGVSGLQQENLTQQPVQANLQTELAEFLQSANQQAAGAQVNRLMVLNQSGKPLYLMPGEIISGGQQDRTIAQEAILASSDKPVPIDVFCVEHGRWSGRALAQTEAVAAAALELHGAVAGNDDSNRDGGPELESTVKKANKGQFITSIGSLNIQGRLAVQGGQSQQMVWDSVAQTNSSSSFMTAGAVNVNGLAFSEAFTVNYVDPGNLKKLKPYLNHLQKSISERDRIVGIIVAINGKVEAVDVFESTPLFRKLWPKLLKSYALDALSIVDESGKTSDCTIADARRFFDQSMKAEVESVESNQGLIVTRRAKDSVISFSAGEDGAGSGGGFAGAVHSAAFSK